MQLKKRTFKIFFSYFHLKQLSEDEEENNINEKENDCTDVLEEKLTYRSEIDNEVYINMMF